MSPDLHQLDLAHVLHHNTDPVALREQGPFVVDRGEGIYVYDSAGKRYIEGLGIAWCLSLGYGEEELVKAASDQMRKLAHAGGFFGRSSEPVIKLAEKLIDMVPYDMSKAFFVNSGSEANDSQIKLIWYYNNAIGRPEKKKIISRFKSYHGLTLAAASLTGLEGFRKDWDVLTDRMIHTDCPHHYRHSEPGETEEEFSTRLAESLESLIQSEGPETIAAFIAEPVMGAGGVMIPPRGYFEKIQKVLKTYDVLFIADEVICGFGRTGNQFGCQTFGIVPDTMTLAKQLSSAYLPIAAVLIPEYMHEVIAEHSSKRRLFGHGYTYGCHPVSAAVALRTLELYEERNIAQHIDGISPRFQQRLQALSDHPMVGDADCSGLIGVVELVTDKQNKTPFDAGLRVGAYCEARAKEHGLIGRAIGDRFAFCPPLIISAEQIDDMFDVFEKALADTEVWLAGRQ